MSSQNFHVAMFPWFAIGHFTPYLHLANKLAEKGNTVTFFLPKKAISLLEHTNSYPNLITFHPITVPHVNGLPLGAETAYDVHLSAMPHLATAMDLTRGQFEAVVAASRPDLVFYDLAHWVPEVARALGIRSVCYNVISPALLAIFMVPAKQVRDDRPLTKEEMAEPPPGYPSRTVVLRPSEMMSDITSPFGEGVTFYTRFTSSLKRCDAIALRTCRETEGAFCDYLGSQFGKRVLLTGPILPKQPSQLKEDRWALWLRQFGPRSVLFCAFGSQHLLEKLQFHELLLGFEQTNMPFLIAVKPPIGASTIEEAFPQGFQERTKDRGIVFGGWVPQPLILGHPSVGCFVSHGGIGSTWESLVSDCQLVMIPQLDDQTLNTRLWTEELKVGVEVEREENGWFSKESLCKAIKIVMDKESEQGEILRKNQAKWKSVIGSPDFMNRYVDEFVHGLEELIQS